MCMCVCVWKGVELGARIHTHEHECWNTVNFAYRICRHIVCSKVWAAAEGAVPIEGVILHEAVPVRHAFEGKGL